MRVRYARRAFIDREAIFDYLAERSPNGALNVQRAIVQTIRRLEGYPDLGRRTEVAGVRELVVPRYPYKIGSRARRHGFSTFAMPGVGSGQIPR